MIKLTFCLALVFICSCNVNAQISDDITEDSVKSLLCKKWGFRAIIMGGQEMSNFNESVNYQFYQDNTLDRVTSKGKREKGKWTYEREKKLITLKIKKVTLFVIKLKPDDLIVSTSKIGDSEGNSLGIATALKLIE